ncbi:thioesterase family protein [Marinicella sp. S1101]|uniref:acyl-CoA thioesterase n=1 Tax=Marinicella marina TaxID=2996016 RepID=UPI00226102D2|nr:thioesterase family protein [Marinicella marina]MCX7552549.1 thioesterase family protein [Marinicella marina]MDJ1139425.1 thioesterase family protein [Marinicella marina]
MQFDEIIKTLLESDDKQVVVDENWAQGRTVYGGLSAAMVFACMQQQVSNNQPNEHRPVRYLNYSFIGPLMTAVPIFVEVEIMRSGRSATQLTAKIMQNDRVCVMAQGCFGIARTSKINITDKHNHHMPLPKKGNFLPQIPKVVPKFLRHFEINLQQGRLPFMHSKKDYMHGWMRFKQRPNGFDDGHLIAAIDAWPCTVLQQLKLPAAASTMNWNLEFPQHQKLPDADQWLAYQAHTEHASDGYVFSDAQIYNPEGGLLALSRQTVGVFA